MKVQVTVVATQNGRSRVESHTLVLHDIPDRKASRIVADTARLVGERAMFGQLLPTPAREGGRAS